MRERLASDGTVVTQIVLEDPNALVEAVAEKGYDAIAICFLIGFRNPQHELAAEPYLRERLPKIDIALSHKVSPGWREFDRLSTTAMDPQRAAAAPGREEDAAARSSGQGGEALGAWDRATQGGGEGART